MLDGVIAGPDSVRAVVLKIKSLYDRQEFLSVGPYGDSGWIEDYVAEFRGEPLGCVVLVKFNDVGQTGRLRGKLSASDLADSLRQSTGRPVRRHPDRRPFPLPSVRRPVNSP